MQHWAKKHQTTLSEVGCLCSAFDGANPSCLRSWWEFTWNCSEPSTKSNLWPWPLLSFPTSKFLVLNHLWKFWVFRILNQWSGRPSEAMMSVRSPGNMRSMLQHWFLQYTAGGMALLDFGSKIRATSQTNMNSTYSWLHWNHWRHMYWIVWTCYMIRYVYLCVYCD